MEFDYKQEDILEEALIADLAKAYHVCKEDLFSYIYGQYMIANIQKGRFPKVSKENRFREVGAFLITQQGWDVSDGSFHLDTTNHYRKPAIRQSVPQRVGEPVFPVLFIGQSFSFYFRSKVEERIDTIQESSDGVSENKRVSRHRAGRVAATLPRQLSRLLTSQCAVSAETPCRLGIGDNGRACAKRTNPHRRNGKKRRCHQRKTIGRLSIYGIWTGWKRGCGPLDGK